ncbi:MAG: FlgD immunoglobulin-like domain containing protein [Ignavibacteria bacterium]|nr:FlgD immunoglobulin-like domain containing protein [Ignavibacteria bacterium]
MKLPIVFLLFAVSSLCFAQTDSVFVEKADGTTIRYAVSAIREITFSGLITSVREQELVQNVLSSFVLRQNYPNPFNPSTTIQYDIPHTGEITISIYDIQGRLVRSLASLTQQAGTHSAVWDGRNDSGLSVSSGNYFCRVDFNHSFLVKKLLLLK